MKIAALPLLASTLLCLSLPLAAQTAPKVPDERAAGGHEKINFLDFYDTNGDASVPDAEFTAQRAADFKRIAASRADIEEDAYVSEFAERLDRQLRAERESQIKQARVRFGVLDTNKDGHISAEEFAAASKKMFASFDTNKDGVVDERDTAEKF